MTVAAVILADTPDTLDPPASALADASGRPAVRRVVDTAWAGGALPSVVVSADPDGAVGAALGGGRGAHVEPATGITGPTARLVAGREAAMALVASTGALLVWPIRFTWVGAETVTTLIEAHGLEPRAMIRPSWRDAPGWPVLLPVTALDVPAAARPEQSVEDLVADLWATAVSVRTLDLGDPGTVHDRATPLDELPPYTGPRAPLRPPPEWGAVLEEDPTGRPDPSGGGPDR